MTHVLCPEKLDRPALTLHGKVRPGVLFFQRRPRTLSDQHPVFTPIPASGTLVLALTYSWKFDRTYTLPFPFTY